MCCASSAHHVPSSAVSGRSAREMTRHSWQDTVRYSALAVVVLAAFPRLVPRWHTDLSSRRVVAHLAFNTAITFALHAWVQPWARRMADVREQAEGELRQQLGRQPTEKELFAHLGIGRAH
jgi:hypothetical protein